MSDKKQLKDAKDKPMKLTEVELGEFGRFDALKTSAANLDRLISLKMENIGLKEEQTKLILNDLGHRRKEVVEERAKLSQQRATLQKDYEDFVGRIRARLKIKGNFGYNPETAEVILDESK